MAVYTQANRPMAVTTPLGDNTLLLVGFIGHEAVSRCFNFSLQLVAEKNKDIDFVGLLAKPISVRINLPRGRKRYLNGICLRVTQGGTDDVFTAYQVEIVPQLWLLTRRSQCRIFQHLAVPDILKEVLKGLDVVYQLQGKYYKRDYCTQYRETDYNFANRLMEEEGIYYFFRHTEGGHQMVVTDSSQTVPDMPEESEVLLDDVWGGVRDDDRVFNWGKTQTLTSGKYTLRDHCFELPRVLEVSRPILETVQVGQVSHKLQVGGNEKLEKFDWPGEFVQRFDGVDRGGRERPADLQLIFEDGPRTVAIRMQEEAVQGLVIRGESTCRQFVTGHQFTLIPQDRAKRKGSKAEGKYLLTSVSHTAHQGGYKSGEGGSFAYHNSFTCIPLALPFRPRRETPRPAAPGTQTAVVVGPPGEEIFTDKYGRVKVQFHWDRDGKSDADSSCWIRVGMPAANKQWGFLRIPRVGEEVIVDFLEGDPDQPIILGSVYNAEMMPPYKLPQNRTQTGLKSLSTPGGQGTHFNELRFEDRTDKEYIYFHAAKDFYRQVENDDTVEVRNGDRKVTVTKGKCETTAAQAIELQTGNSSIKMTDQSIQMKVGDSTITMDKAGVSVKGLTTTMEGEVKAQVQGMVAQVNGGALAQVNGKVFPGGGALGSAGGGGDPLHGLMQEVMSEAVSKLQSALGQGGHGLGGGLMNQVIQGAAGKLANSLIPAGPGGTNDPLQGLIHQVVSDAVNKLAGALQPDGKGKPAPTPPAPPTPPPAQAGKGVPKKGAPHEAR